MVGRKTALITGATGGIGEELCREFARQGHDLVITARSRERLERQAVRLRRTYGAQVHIIAEDLANPEAANRIYNWFKSCGIQLDVLVNNAGYGAGGAFATQSVGLVENMVAVNILSPMRLCRLFLPDMAARGAGKVLNIASTGSFVAGPMNAVYCATKAHMLSFSEALAYEMRDSGIQVTAVCPGATRSGFAHRARMEETLLFHLGVLSPKQVAREAFRAMEQGKTVHVVGWANRLMIGASRPAPRGLCTQVSALMQRPDAFKAPRLQESRKGAGADR